MRSCFPVFHTNIKYSNRYALEVFALQNDPLFDKFFGKKRMRNKSLGTVLTNVLVRLREER